MIHIRGIKEIEKFGIDGGLIRISGANYYAIYSIIAGIISREKLTAEIVIKILDRYNIFYTIKNGQLKLRKNFNYERQYFNKGKLVLAEQTLENKKYILKNGWIVEDGELTEFKGKF